MTTHIPSTADLTFVASTQSGVMMAILDAGATLNKYGGQKEKAGAFAKITFDDRGVPHLSALVAADHNGKPKGWILDEEPGHYSKPGVFIDTTHVINTGKEITVPGISNSNGGVICYEAKSPSVVVVNPDHEGNPDLNDCYLVEIDKSLKLFKLTAAQKQQLGIES